MERETKSFGQEIERNWHDDDAVFLVEVEVRKRPSIESFD
jgi:hypothetical protein